MRRIVAACSDTFELPKPPWEQRKADYMRSIASKEADELRVSLADKVHDARSILRSGRAGPSRVRPALAPGERLAALAVEPHERHADVRGRPEKSRRAGCGHLGQERPERCVPVPELAAASGAAEPYAFSTHGRYAQPPAEHGVIEIKRRRTGQVHRGAPRASAATDRAVALGCSRGPSLTSASA